VDQLQKAEHERGDRHQDPQPCQSREVRFNEVNDHGNSDERQQDRDHVDKHSIPLWLLRVMFFLVRNAIRQKPDRLSEQVPRFDQLIGNWHPLGPIAKVLRDDGLPTVRGPSTRGAKMLVWADLYSALFTTSLRLLNDGAHALRTRHNFGTRAA
jgi:hypothetical protein